MPLVEFDDVERLILELAEERGWPLDRDDLCVVLCDLWAMVKDDALYPDPEEKVVGYV